MSASRRPRRAERWKLCLYVAGEGPKSMAAISALKQLCEERLKGRYTIEVVDLLQSPQRARRDQIVALPTLVRRLPTPLRQLIGDLSDRQRVLVALDLEKAP